ncbi:FeoA family protein [Aminipila luticellarii]|uniref:Ferrous iron transport protein A n=1 Tax=Aminipila luticellarii TaxID=2507160 RepID=A0A410PT87_9FIRM|nr:ferrous iron transport protein A [Aminipila luticellarii]
MMPLTMTTPGTQVTVSTIKGKDDTKRFLETLGFVTGTQVMVISELGGNVIVNVKEARVAISKAMASRILIH